MEGIIGMTLASCMDPNCEECHGVNWFIMGMNPFGMYTPAKNVVKPGLLGDSVTFELDDHNYAINVEKN